MPILKKTGWFLLIVFIALQFFGPDKNLGDFESISGFYLDTNPSEEVKGILKESCFDCHSDVTRYPWYSHITPVNYWMAGHIDHAKEEFNVSNWNDNSVERKDHKFEELKEKVEEREMPLRSYTWVHKEANLSKDQIKAIIDWADQVRFKYALSPKPE